MAPWFAPRPGASGARVAWLLQRAQSGRLRFDVKETVDIRPLPDSIDATVDLLAQADYLTDRSLGTVLFLALKMGRPLFLEGEAGVGKTEIAKVLSQTLGRRLIRLQCYEGLDIAAAVYEWNYAAQMIAIRAAEAEGEHDRARI